MILRGYDIPTIIIATLCVSLAVLILVIAYKKLLQYLGRGSLNKQDFCVLFPLEKDPASGEVEFYFTCEESKQYSLEILDAEMQEFMKVKEGEASPGGTIVRFDTTSLSNGLYYFCLITSNQKTMKKMNVLNG
ncbi:hypothetical protein N9355_03120 [Crocinitomicaceae bacterium]|nr:hypothetical protein [Crocinitomicaceae bacterium]